MPASQSYYSTVSNMNYFWNSRGMESYSKQKPLYIMAMFSLVYEGMPVTSTVVRVEHMLTNRSIQVKCKYVIYCYKKQNMGFCQFIQEEGRYKKV